MRLDDVVLRVTGRGGLTLRVVVGSALIADAHNETKFVDQLERDLMFCDEEGYFPLATDDQIEARLVEWRRERGFLAAEDVEGFLETMDVSLDQLTAFLSRAQAAEHSDEELVARGLVQKSVPFDQLADQLLIELVLRPYVISDLTSLVALRACAPPGVWPVSADFATTTAAMKKLRAIGLHDESTIADAIMREQSYRQFTTRLCTESKLLEELARNRSALTRLHFMTATFQTESSAREAYERIVIDELPFDECTRSLGGVLAHHVTTAEEAQRSPTLERLAFQRKAEVLPPTKSDASWQLHQIVARNPPTLSDVDVRARCESSLINRALRPQLFKQVSFVAAD